MEARFIQSSHAKHPMLVVDVDEDEDEDAAAGRQWLFMRKDARGNGAVRYQCHRCHRLSNYTGAARFPVPAVSVRDGVMRSNPQDGHQCEAFTKEEVVAVTVKRDVFQTVEKGHAFDAAFTQGNAKLLKRAREEEVNSDDVARVFPAQHQMKRQANRHKRKGLPAVDDWLNLNDSVYRYTWRGRPDNEDGQFEGERWLLRLSEQPPFVLFASDREIDMIQHARFLVADGTFKKSPPGWFQIYTFHTEIDGEPLPVGFALMQDKLQVTYAAVFRALRDRLVERHGGVTHGLERILTDFEDAAIAAVEEVFGDDGVQHLGCVFHRAQAFQRKVDAVGLRDVYRQRGETWRWVRRCVALCMLPLEQIEPFFDAELRGYPATIDDEAERAACERLVTYQDNYWFRRVPQWCHDGNLGPRTTNICEGYHSKLCHVLANHPKLDIFLHQLQKENYVTLNRISQLVDGRQPKPKNRKFARLNERLMAAQESLHDDLLLMGHAGAMERARMMQHLDYVQYLLGGEPDAAADGAEEQE